MEQEFSAVNDFIYPFGSDDFSSRFSSFFSLTMAQRKSGMAVEIWCSDIAHTD